jgi:cellobiose phosphorylase
MYRLIVESLLGLRLEKDRLHIVPCLPADWGAFTVRYRYRKTIYHITIKALEEPAGDGATNIIVDGVMQEYKWIRLVDDHSEHAAEVLISKA